MNTLDGLPPLRDIINEYQLSAKKSLGQNFLLDLNLTNKIARMAGDLTNHTILEIGPGPGGLTRALLNSGAKKVLAIERDERLIPALNQIKDHFDNRLEVKYADALNENIEAYLNGPVKVVANLPYNIGTELLVRWLTPSVWPPYWESLTLMFQKEVAKRIVATPGSKAYGRLALLVQWRCDAKIVMEISPHAFTPPPKVTSAVVHIERLKKPRFEADGKVLEKIVAAAFNQRRKMLRVSLKAFSPIIENILIDVGIKPTQRAEEISLKQFCALAQKLN
ncbi:16S rRNA (adenine(1518)-N(6)/adenine(1519)-N(6))-dimethyltransferase RsmA [Amylibacter sp.]|nr:16S rRNA (adenine(1518)-N(6)/adenine(1519)-N(6))-dimethyltransferase RsmA [Amylibacter sp.]